MLLICRILQIKGTPIRSWKQHASTYLAHGCIASLINFACSRVAMEDYACLTKPIYLLLSSPDTGFVENDSLVRSCS